MLVNQFVRYQCADMDTAGATFTDRNELICSAHAWRATAAPHTEKKTWLQMIGPFGTGGRGTQTWEMHVHKTYIIFEVTDVNKAFAADFEGSDKKGELKRCRLDVAHIRFQTFWWLPRRSTNAGQKPASSAIPQQGYNRGTVKNCTYPMAQVMRQSHGSVF